MALTTDDADDGKDVAMTTQRIIPGDCIAGLSTLPDASVHCCVTSPPYWNLRDYNHAGQIGLEPTPEAYVARMVEVFSEVRRVLRDDGTLWLNLGDSYADVGRSHKKRAKDASGVVRPAALKACERCGQEFEGGLGRRFCPSFCGGSDNSKRAERDGGLKHKDLVGIPWRVAFALQADGWWLRQDIIWAKPNPMPESVRDRCTKAHEYVFLLTKSARYYYDNDSIREPVKAHAAKGLLESRDLTMSKKEQERARMAHEVWGSNQMSKPTHAMFQGYDEVKGANRRSVWTVTTKPYSGAHFATMPPDLVEPCILAGCPEGGTVLDPFAGSGTTLAVSAELGRNAVGCELNPEYVRLAYERIAKAREKAPLFA